jgi:hypothetical protein
MADGGAKAAPSLAMSVGADWSNGSVPTALRVMARPTGAKSYPRVRWNDPLEPPYCVSHLSAMTAEPSLGPIDAEWLAFPPGSRFVIEPDPAWDAAVETDGELVVEVTWLPNALAGRGDELVASLALVDALTVAGITGFTTAPARAIIPDGAFVEPGTAPPVVVRLLTGDDPAADLAYVDGHGLIASPRATAIIVGHCGEAAVSPWRGSSDARLR